MKYEIEMKGDRMRGAMITVRVSLSLLFMQAMPVFASGRSLESSANSAVNTALTLARVLCLLGYLAAAIAWNIPGLTHWAKRITGGAFLGSICAFGGPAFIEGIKVIFG